MYIHCFYFLFFLVFFFFSSLQSDENVLPQLLVREKGREVSRTFQQRPLVVDKSTTCHALPCLLTFTLVVVFDFPSMHQSIFSHSSREGLRSQNKPNVMFLWHLHPAAPLDSHTTSRPPERCNPFSVRCVFPLALLPVSLTCVVPTGRCLSSILAKFSCLCSEEQLNFETLLDS